MQGHEQEDRDEAKDDDPGHLESLEQAIDSALENRRLFLPWQSGYSKLKKQFQQINLHDWKTELLKLGK